MRSCSTSIARASVAMTARALLTSFAPSSIVPSGVGPSGSEAAWNWAFIETESWYENARSANS